MATPSTIALRVFMAAAIVVLGIAVWSLSAQVASLTAEVERPGTLDANTPIIARWQTPDGNEVLPPEVMPLWRYVQEPDNANHALIWRFFSAFEADLHADDATFHTTHELIDGQEW